jgi:hypothetical protein
LIPAGFVAWEYRMQFFVSCNHERILGLKNNAWATFGTYGMLEQENDFRPRLVRIYWGLVEGHIIPLGHMLLL